eukprot:2610572-Karenia_brevis.AAC.1
MKDGVAMRQVVMHEAFDEGGTVKEVIEQTPEKGGQSSNDAYEKKSEEKKAEGKETKKDEAKDEKKLDGDGLAGDG